MKTVLYQEEEGAVNTELGKDGVWVRLTRWEDESGYQNCSHYLLEKTVLVDGKYALNTMEAIPSYYPTSDCLMQRRAISEFDKLVASHPAFGEGWNRSS